MKLKLVIVLLLLIGGQCSALTPIDTSDLKFLPFVDLEPYGLDGMGFIRENAVEAMLRIKLFLVLKDEVSRSQVIISDLKLDVENQREQTAAATRLSDQFKAEAKQQEKLGNAKSTTGFLIGGASGLVLGTVLAAIIVSSVKK